MSRARALIASSAVALCLSLGCASGGKTGATGDVVFNAGGVDVHDGKRVTVRGIYALIDARKKSEADAADVYDGHVALILEDGTRVLLESIYSPKAIRSEEEIERFAGRVVVATGVLTKLPPPQPDNPQDLVMPCLSDVDDIHVP